MSRLFWEFFETEQFALLVYTSIGQERTAVVIHQSAARL
jgi:hypothetical protein